MSSEVESLEAAVGRRVRNWREGAGITLDQFANRAREHGLKWSTARVLEFEKGQLRVTLANLLAVAQSLASLTGELVALPDLIPNDVKWIRVTEEWLVRPAGLRSVLKGSPVDLGNLTAIEPVAPADVLVPTLAEERAAKRLGVRPRQVAMWAYMLWGHHLDDEVRIRAGEDSTPQRRGHVSRNVVEELGRQVNRGADGND